MTSPPSCSMTLACFVHSGYSSSMMARAAFCVMPLYTSGWLHRQWYISSWVFIMVVVSLSRSGFFTSRRPAGRRGLRLRPPRRARTWFSSSWRRRKGSFSLTWRPWPRRWNRCIHPCGTGAFSESILPFSRFSPPSVLALLP